MQGKRRYGSSLVVYPAAGFPAMAKRNGAKLVILNREPRSDIRAITDIWRVVRGGYILDPRSIPFE